MEKNGDNKNQKQKKFKMNLNFLSKKLLESLMQKTLKS